MLCGNRSWSLKIGKKFFLLLICCSGVLSVACQSKPKDVASILQPCQELVDKEELLAVGKCYNEQLAANPQFAAEMEESFSKRFFKKCLELKEKKDYEKAIVCLEGVSVLASDSANVQLHLADSYYKLSKSFRYQDDDLLDRAETAIKKSLEINPGKSITYETYGEILESRKKFQLSLEAHQKALEIEPKKFRLWMNVALSQEKTGDISSALASYHQALVLEPKDTLALYNSAKLYEKTGNVDQAIENFEKLLKIQNEFDDARERLENLKKQKNQPKGKTKSPEVYRGVANDGTSILP